MGDEMCFGSKLKLWSSLVIGSVLCLETAPIAAFVAITQAAGGAGQNPKAKRRAEAPAEDGRGAAILLRDAKARRAGGK